MTLSEAQVCRHPTMAFGLSPQTPGFLFLPSITFSACCAHYPGGSNRYCFGCMRLSPRRAFPIRTGLPGTNGRSASTALLSGPAQASRMLRPADLLTHLMWAWSEGSSTSRYQLALLLSYPGIPITPGAGLAPAGGRRVKSARSFCNLAIWRRANCIFREAARSISRNLIRMPSRFRSGIR